MNEAFKALTATAATVAVFVLSASWMTQDADAQAIPVVPDIPTVTVTLPGQTVTVKVPQPVKTVTIPGPTVTVPGGTVTVRPPGVTETVRIPGPTQTVTVRPNNTQPSVKPSEAPTATTTITPSAGQTTTPDGTVGQEPTVPAPSDDTQRIDTVVEKVVVGTLVTLIIAGIGILALFFGYMLGRKDAERQQQGFYRSLLGIVRGEQPKE